VKNEEKEPVRLGDKVGEGDAKARRHGDAARVGVNEPRTSGWVGAGFAFAVGMESDRLRRMWEDVDAVLCTLRL